MSSARLKAAAAALSITPTVREALRGALHQEVVAATQMSDDVFWGYDQAWLSLGQPTLEDMRKAGACGGGGCNMTYNNNQFWSLAQACDRAAFSLVMFQQRRYMAAQLRLQRLLELAPDRRILDGFDRYAATGGSVREACAGAAVRDKPTEWAAWCMDVLKVVGVLRWASNMTWSDGSVAIPDMSSAVLQTRVQSFTGEQSGCGYVPDCTSDAFGVPQYGYVAGNAPGGMLRYEAVTGTKRYGFRYMGTAAAVYRGSAEPEFLQAAAGWKPEARPVMVGRGSLWSVAPKALGLHKSSRSFDWVRSIVPVGMDDFEPVMLPDAVFPSILRAPAGSGAFAWFLALFAELDAPATQMAVRERTGAWWFLATGTSGRDYAYPTPAGEIVVWRVLAALRDAAGLSFGQAMVLGFQNVERTIEMLPAWAKTQALTDAAAAMRGVLRAQQQEAAATMGAVFSGVGAIVGAIVPVAGLIIAVVGALVTALTGAAVDLGLLREGNPPAIQFLAARQIPTPPGGDDRCAVNPGEETYALYRDRAVAPTAEAARRTGGQADAMFDEIARVRAERAGLVPPEDGASGQKPWGFAAVGGVAGTVLIRLLLGV